MVKIYTRTTCAPCKAVKAWLKNKGVSYEEVDIDSDPSILQEIVDNTGLVMVPVTVIDGNYVSGMNFSRLSSLLMV